MSMSCTSPVIWIGMSSRNRFTAIIGTCKFSNIQIYVRYRFEKLDITPKSAQKIKPVLERWMKEAEER